MHIGSSPHRRNETIVVKIWDACSRPPMYHCPIVYTTDIKSLLFTPTMIFLLTTNILLIT